MSDAPRSSRSFKKIETADLIRLGEIAFQTLTREFERRRSLPKLDERKIIGMCLCQGAADHYFQYESRKSPGINDFDVWAFFEPLEVLRFGNKKPATVDFGTPKFGKSFQANKQFEGRAWMYFGGPYPTPSRSTRSRQSSTISKNQNRRQHVSYERGRQY